MNNGPYTYWLSHQTSFVLFEIIARTSQQVVSDIFVHPSIFAACRFICF